MCIDKKKKKVLETVHRREVLGGKGECTTIKGGAPTLELDIRGGNTTLEPVLRREIELENLPKTNFQEGYVRRKII